MKCAVYARYSSDNQRAASIEDQVRLSRAYIEQQGWRYLDAYTDRALSGASSLRPGYQKLLEDARAGPSRSWWPSLPIAFREIRPMWPISTSTSPSSALSVVR